MGTAAQQDAMEFHTPSHFQSITGGRWLLEPVDDARVITGYSFDTRSIAAGDLFVAVRGEGSDGHAYVRQAIDKGAAMVVVDREDQGDLIAAVAHFKSEISNSQSSASSLNACILLVDDSVLALQQIAAAWREELGRHGVKVIAVTGSNGKTTTRHMIHGALSSTLRGTQSPKSFNNHLGVPLTLLAASTLDDFVVAEVGTNHPGEIATLAKILRPHVAVITNIGTAHIGMFGSKDAIAREKSSLFEHIEPGGVAVMGGGQPYEEAWRSQVVPMGVKVITFGRMSACDVSTKGSTGADACGLHFELNTGASVTGTSVTLPLLGEHNIDNALAAIAVARAMGVSDEQAAAALGKLTGVAMRMQIVRVGVKQLGSPHAKDGAAITIIHDAYNANPDSMHAALNTLASLPAAATRRVAVLGDMLELGEDTDREHRRIGERLNELNAIARAGVGAVADVAEIATNEPKNIHKVIFIGPHMKQAADQLARTWPAESITHYDQWCDDLPQRVAVQLCEGDLVLLKASRGLRFERLMPAIETRFGEPRHQMIG